MPPLRVGSLLHSGSVLVWPQLAVPSAGVGGFAQVHISAALHTWAAAQLLCQLQLWLCVSPAAASAAQVEGAVAVVCVADSCLQ